MLCYCKQACLVQRDSKVKLDLPEPKVQKLSFIRVFIRLVKTLVGPGINRVLLEAWTLLKF